MSEEIIKFTTANSDGNGIQQNALARVYGSAVTLETLDKLQKAVADYKKENDGSWDMDNCLDIAKEVLEENGCEVHFVTPSIEVVI